MMTVVHEYDPVSTGSRGRRRAVSQHGSAHRRRGEGKSDNAIAGALSERVRDLGCRRVDIGQSATTPTAGTAESATASTDARAVSAATATASTATIFIRA
jgi:hypothetical protein